MKRIMIVGGAGSGKSTLARAVGAKLDLPVHHMDLIHWQENWVERPQDQKIPLALEIEARDTWVFEGGLSATYENRFARSDVLIWLDLPVGLRLWRVTKRLFTHLGQNRPDLPKGCTERLHRETLAFYKFIWQFRHISRNKIAELIKPQDRQARVVHLRSPQEVATFLRELTTS